MKAIQKMHQHSLEAYAAYDGKFKTIKHKIFHKLMREPSLTDKQLASRLGMAIASIQPRCSDLLREGVIVEDGEKKCRRSGIMVRTLRIWREGDPLPKDDTYDIKHILEVAKCWCAERSMPATAENVVIALVSLGRCK